MLKFDSLRCMVMAQIQFYVMKKKKIVRLPNPPHPPTFNPFKVDVIHVSSLNIYDRKSKRS